MRTPSFGVELHQYFDARAILEEAQQAERLGYDSVWFGDSQLLWRELYVLLGAAAATTSRIKLGTGVSNPITRHASVQASAIMTAQELSLGRALFGIGVGNTALSSMGQREATRAMLEAYVATVRQLCAGQQVEGPTGPMHLAYGSAEQAPPTIIAGSGPKMLALAGKIGDGAIVTREARAGDTLKAMLACIRASREQAGRLDKPFMTCLSASVAVHDDRQIALTAVRPHVASAIRRLHWQFNDLVHETSRRVAAAYDVYAHMAPGAAHAELIPDEVVTEFAIAGTPEDCIAQIQPLFELEIDEITIRPYSLPSQSRADTMAAFARRVMDPLLGR
jgi:5,10-methylenetetrahydromethanopterin reductase